MSKFFRWTAYVRFSCFVLALTCAALLDGPLLAQDSGAQRDFFASASAVQAAVQSASPTSKGRLPTLAGFVQPTEQAIDRYDKGFYECTFLVSPASNGRTTVRVTAKLTAWYNDADPAKSGYRVLLSNGRLEADVLDRIADKLSPGSSSAGASSATVGTGVPQTADRRLNLGNTAAHPSASSTDIVSPHADSGPVLPPGTNLESLKAKRAEDEKESQALSSYLKNLEEIQRNQSHPNDLAAIRKNKTPIFAKASETAQLLMNADAQDEFQVLSIEGQWVHVQISGVSRGWIRRNQLEMPKGFAEASDNTAAGPSTAAPIFKVAKEGSSSFRGDWAPLKGKAVRFEWVEPSSPALATTRQEKLTFAKSVFLNVYQSATSAQPAAEGIVVVFDSADGGQVAATMASVKELANRSISDSAFWRQCSLDPPESFLSNNKP